MTVANLPAAAYSASSPTPAALAAVAEDVASAADRSDRLTTLARVQARLRPAAATLNQPFRTELGTLVDDLVADPLPHADEVVVRALEPLMRQQVREQPRSGSEPRAPSGWPVVRPPSARRPAGWPRASGRYAAGSATRV